MHSPIRIAGKLVTPFGVGSVPTIGGRFPDKLNLSGALSGPPQPSTPPPTGQKHPLTQAERGGYMTRGGWIPLTPAGEAERKANLTPQQRKHEEDQARIKTENEAAKTRIATKETEADPFTIPGQEDARVLFQKAQKRAPGAAEQAELKKYVKVASDIASAGGGGLIRSQPISDEDKQRLFIGIVSRLQFYLDHLKEPRGKEVDEINAQTAETMEANAYAKQFVMRGGAGTEGQGDKRGWNWPNFDTLDFFRTTQQREPTQTEEKILIKFVKLVDDARAHGAAGDNNAEKEFDLLHRKAAYFAQHLEEPRHTDLEKLRRDADEIVSKHVAKYYANKPKGAWGEIVDWGHTASKGFNAFKQIPGIKQLAAANDFILHGAAEYYKQMGAATGSIPFVGSGLQAGIGIFGGDELAAADAIARGANISDATMSGLKKALADAAAVSDYLTAITAFVPGFGQIAAGISGAIAGASALASGKSITDALMAAAEDAVMSMIPAGKFAGLAKKVAQGAFQMARVMIEGGSVEAGAEAALIKNLPGGDTAQKAVKEALAVAKAAAGGKPLDKIALDRLRAHLPADVLKAFDVGLSFAEGKKIQAIVAKNVKSLNLGPDQIGKLADQGSQLVKLSKPFQAAAEDLKGSALKGFHFATGVLARSGILPDTLVAMRAKLGPEGKRGFDRALAAHADVAAKLGPIKKAVAGVAPPSAPTARSAPLTQQQIDLQKLAQLTPAQQKQLVDYANLQQLAKLTPAQQKQLVEYAKAQQDLKKLAQLTPTQQKQLVEYAKAQQDLQKLAQLTPEDQQRLAEYAKTVAPKSMVTAATATAVVAAAAAATRPAQPITPKPASESAKVAQAATAPAVVPATSAYPPYPQSVTGVSAPPPHPGGHPHPGHPGGGGRHPAIFRGGRATRGWGPWWDGSQVVTGVVSETCRTWGDPVAMLPSMQVSAKVALGASGGRPTTMRGENGGLYLFSYENNGIVARPCAAVGALNAPPPETTWGPATTDMPHDMRWAGMSAVNGSRGRPRAAQGPGGVNYLFEIKGGVLTARRAVG